MDQHWKQVSPGHYVPYRKWERQEKKEREFDWAVAYALAAIVGMFTAIGLVLGGMTL
jgi:hypothetical protein